MVTAMSANSQWIQWSVVTAALSLLWLTGCDVDRDHPKYDQLRYEELRKANCGDMAAVLSKPLLSEETEDYDAALARCRVMQSLTFEEYRKLADHARRTGKWDVYGLFPDKRPTPPSTTDQTH